MGFAQSIRDVTEHGVTLLRELICGSVVRLE